MVELYCAPFVDLIDRMRLEFERQQAIFDLPQRRWWLPSQASDAPDLSVRFHDSRAGTPVGPASGPQTQMAQNLVLSWLAGSRIMELKTVQINDQLTIGRPCIDAANIGFNIEFSQELRVHDSLDQYVQGAMLIHMLRAAPEVFGRPFGDVDFAATAGETIYDMSIGYDLAGIQTEKVRKFIRGMIDATPTVERLRRLIPSRLSALRDLDYPTNLSGSITLSTFHGCPAEEIERIAEFLLTEMGVHTIVKMNPPMLGKERLEQLLHDTLGYRDLTVNPSAYTSGLQFDQSIAMCRRMMDLAKSRGLVFGAKFSNTLEVVNHRDFFPAAEKVMYLSGAPLHVITLALTDVFRQAMGPEIPISYSAGVDRKNFPNMVACGFLPVTTCTDLLKTGGYGRLAPYLQDLETDMRVRGARTIDDYILRAREQGFAAHGHRRRNRGRRSLHRRQEQHDPAADQFAPRALRLHHLRQVRPRLPERRQLHLRNAARRLALPRYRSCTGWHDPRSRRRAPFRHRPQRTNRQLCRLLQSLRQLRHLLPRVGRALPQETEFLRQPRILRRRRRPRRLPPRRRTRQLHPPRPHRRHPLPPL
jgi:putative selenate reductase